MDICTDVAELDDWIAGHVQEGQAVPPTTMEWARARLAEGKRLEWGSIRAPGDVEKTTILALPAVTASHG